MPKTQPSPPSPGVPSAVCRLPTAIPQGVLFGLALHLGFFAVYSTVMGSLARTMGIPPHAALRWGLLTFLTSLALLAWNPLLERLRARGFDGTRLDVRCPRLSSWVVYFGTASLLAFAAAALRSALAPWALGFALEPRLFWQFVAQIVLASVTAIAAIEFFASRRRSRLEWLAVSERLEHDQERLRLELVALDDRLRREAAHHLHGEVQSRLLMASALLMHAQAAPSDAEARPLLSRAREQLDLLRGQGVAHARDLLGTSEADRPLSQLAMDLAGRFRAVVPVELVIEPAAEAAEDHLEAELRRQTHLILEEALLNAFRHGHPSRIRVRLAASGPRELVLTVQDDGLGFEPGASFAGLGLSALRDEFEQAGGRLDLASRPGRGTRVTMHLPLRAPVAGARE
jgi:signal transduction histidine kinase